MPEDPQDGRSRNYVLMRTLMDVGMGIIYIGMAMLFLFASRFGLYSFILEPPFNYIFAGICIAYGSFRIYRGVKKNYCRPSSILFSSEPVFWISSLYMEQA